MQLKVTLFNLHKQHQNSLLFHACMFVENISIGFIKKTGHLPMHYFLSMEAMLQPCRQGLLNNLGIYQSLIRG